MTRFSIKNIFVYWLRMWPVTLVLLVLGALGGVFAVASMSQSYVSTVKILVVNSDTGVISTDYVGLLNSTLIINAARESADVDEGCSLQSTGSGNVLTIVAVNSDTGVISTNYVGLLNSTLIINAARESADVDEGCSLQSTGSGNVLTIVASCLSNEEDSEKFAAETIAVFTQKIENLYGSDSVVVDNLFDEIKATRALSEQDFAARIIMMVVAGLLLSGVIAFVRFDYTNSKQRKK